MNIISKVMSISFITNTFLSIFKIMFGFIGKSGALIADGIHSLSDTLTDVFAIIGNKISTKPADKKHPFGHGNAEYLTCIIIGCIIFSLGISIIYEGIVKQVTIPSFYVAVISLITIFAKLLLSKFILNKGYKYNSNILIASGKESFSDVISSIVVLISVLLSQLKQVNIIFASCDKIAMIIVGLLIIKIAYTILKENLSNLLGEQVNDKNYINEFTKIINNNELVKKVDKLIILKSGPNYKIDCELSMDPDIKLREVHDNLEKIENEIKNKDNRIINIIIHVNPYIKK